MLVDDNPPTIEALPPLAADDSPAVTLNAPLTPSPEPTEIEILPPEPDADEPLPMSTAPLTSTVALSVPRDTPDTPALLAAAFSVVDVVSPPAAT
jgi:hypothetical protein